MMLTMTHASSPASRGARSANTPRDNFVSRQLEETAALTLDGEGFIHDCNASGEKFFKYRRCELLGLKISTLLPELGNFELMGKGHPNPRLHFLCRTGRRFLALTKDGGHVPCALYLNLLDNAGKARLTLLVREA
jgi:PAS domain S-box-containing protein